MDQDNSKGQDKRNWRERLGIGAQGSKDLPKISDDFRSDPPAASARPVATAARPAPSAAAPAVKPAPMAPRVAPPVSRANPKAIQPAPIPSDKLAERLRSQRDASTKLAEQRVQVAKQRAESQQYVPPAPAPVAPQAQAPKPKFTFAEEAAAQARPAVAAPVARPAAQAPAPQLAPARPPLGGMQPPPQNAFAPRPQVAPPVQQQPAPNYQQPPMGVPQYQPQYNQQPVPPYRPIDPNTGYAPPPGYVPQQRGFAPPPMQQPAFQPPPPNGPRLNVPQRQAGALNPNFAPTNFQPNVGQPSFNAGPRLNPPQPRMPAPSNEPEGEYEEEFYDEVPTPRATRPTTTDYKQAYQEAEYGYEDEAPRSKAPWILAGLVLATMLLAGLGVWLYQSSIKPLMSGQSATQEVPAVAPPETPAKVQAETPAAETPQPAVAAPSKKQIYDRIVGDQEVLGGEVAPEAEAPAAIPEPSTQPATNEATPDPAGGTGEDATPLPIPPPPGGANEQQGSIDPASQKQSAETITPAAGESQAAVAAQGDVAAPLALDPPAPGELKTSTEQQSPAPETEAVEDTPAPVTPKKKPVVAAKKKPEPKKTAEKPFDGKPVVLVAPQKVAKAKPRKTVNETTEIANVASDDGGLYAGDGIVDGATPQTKVVAAPPKKKTLFGNVFNANNDAAETTADNLQTATPPPAPAKKVIAPETQVASGASGFVVQLASFRSKAEAQTEYARLKAKHSGTLGRFSPIINEATVGGSTRYRLSVGNMESKAQANAVCSSLFAGGERDCLVKNR
jgi:hypothetical protein